MTDQSITQGEFQRFQDQLISLKESKYKTEEKCEVLCRKVSQLEMKCSFLERELVKANEFKSKLRGGRDIEILIADNQVLRDRMSAIEVNFKLQNEILKAECERLLSENERLKCQIETYKLPNLLLNGVVKEDSCEENSSVNVCDQDQKYKVRSLQFEIAKLIEEKEKCECNNERLRKCVEDVTQEEKELVLRLDSLLNEKRQLMLANDKLVEGEERSRLMYNLEIDILSQKHEEKLQGVLLDHELALQSLITLESKHERDIKAFQLQLEEENRISCDIREKNFLKELDDVRIKKEAQESNFKAAFDEWQVQMNCATEEWRSRIEVIEIDHDRVLREKDAQHLLIVKELEANILSFSQDLKFAEEELKLYGKKNQRLLKDVKKQLEKEIKISQDAQSRVEVQSYGSQNSQTKVSDYLSGNHQLYNADDQSSIYSSSINGATGECQLQCISVTYEEFRNLLDRLTSTQNDFCEFKRKIEVLNQEKNQLIGTIRRQDKIILNYIKNRGGGDSRDNSPDHSRKDQSTSEALTLNGLMSSPVHSKTSLSTLLNKVKETMKSLSTHDILSTSNDRFSYRVTDVDVKQLQRVCEELMMRCLNLETDLQSAVDFNYKLTTRLHCLEESTK